MGRRLACASRVSVAVDLMAPVILSVAILWTFASLSATPFEPRCSLLSPSEYMGLNHRGELPAGIKVCTECEYGVEEVQYVRDKS